MKRIDIMKTGASIAVIIILAVLIVNINRIIPIKAPETIEEQTAPKAGKEEPNKGETAGAITDYGKCFSGYDKSADTIVFVHSNYCPHCKNMMPIVQELEKEGYRFYWAESSDSEATEMVSNCFSGLLSGYVPQFICPKTGKEQTGGMSKEDLKRFADGCV